MRIAEILPSARFVTIVVSIAFAGGLIAVADYTTKIPAPTSLSVNTPTPGMDWKAALEEIQAQNPLNSLPQAPNEENVGALLTAATSDNITDTVARTLFIQLSDAKAQGLGNDIPTQDALIAEAAERIERERNTVTYTTADLKISDNSKESLRVYGNTVMSILLAHPEASVNATLLIIATAAENNNSAKLRELRAIGESYEAVAKGLLSAPTPSTLAPLHLSAVNNITRMAETYADMELMMTDPLRGLGGLQLYQSLGDETGRVFTSIASVFSKNGILFNKEEPGNAWSLLAP